MLTFSSRGEGIRRALRPRNSKPYPEGGGGGRAAVCGTRGPAPLCPTAGGSGERTMTSGGAVPPRARSSTAGERSRLVSAAAPPGVRVLRIRLPEEHVAPAACSGVPMRRASAVPCVHPGPSAFAFRSESGFSELPDLPSCKGWGGVSQSLAGIESCHSGRMSAADGDGAQFCRISLRNPTGNPVSGISCRSSRPPGAGPAAGFLDPASKLAAGRRLASAVRYVT